MPDRSCRPATWASKPTSRRAASRSSTCSTTCTAAVRPNRAIKARGSGSLFVISYDMSSYTFAEDAAPADVNIYAVATLDAVYPRAPSRSFDVQFRTSSGTAASPGDFNTINRSWDFVQANYVSDGDKFVARKRLQTGPGVKFTIVNDDVYEGSESLTVQILKNTSTPNGLLLFAYPDGSTCEAGACSPIPAYEVTITDEEDLPDDDTPQVTGTPRVPSDRPTVFIEAVEGTVTEGEPARFRVRLSQTWATTVNVHLDGRETERMVSGNTNVSRTSTDDDDWREAASELTMRVVPGRGDYTVDETATATVRIEDNDQAVARTPDVPQRVEAIPGDGRVTLVWEPPHSDGGQTITSYEYRARHTSPFGAAGTTGETWVSMDSARSSYVVGDLDNDVQGQVTVYVFQLRAVNAEGAGDPSREARARQMPYAQRPGSPRHLTAVGNADGSVTLHWEAPVTDGGSDITHYEYIAEESFSAREGPAVSVTVTWASTGSNAPGVTASHRNGSGPTRGEVLSGGVTYAFAVRAVNAKGPSPLFSNRAWAMPTAEPAAQTATLEGLPPTHDGASAFTFRIAFSAEVTIPGQSMKDHALTVTGGTVTTARRSR